MKIYFLGTNGWYDTSTGNTTCTLVETDEYFLILDAGNGLYKISEHIKDSNKPIYLFLSHFHLDHIIGMHILNKFNFNQGIEIYGQIGTEKILNSIIKEPYTVPFENLNLNINITELEEGKHKIPFNINCKYLLHSSSCYGYRFEIDDKILAYCTDTGICDNIFELAKNADLLITECSLKSGESSPKWPHLNPEDILKIANESKAKKLSLIHFDANNYNSIEDRIKVKEQLNKCSQNIEVAFDDNYIEI